MVETASKRGPWPVHQMKQPEDESSSCGETNSELRDQPLAILR